MEKSVKKSAFSGRKRNKTALYITAQQRCEQFGPQLHEDGGKLFCSACNVVLDHIRKSTITDHLRSKTHMKRLAEFSEECVRKKQKTLTTSLQCNTVAQVEKISVVQDFVKMCLEAGIPLEKANHPSVCTFLLAHVKNSDIPPSDQLRKVGLPDVHKAKQICVNQKFV
uniref:U1-type domain-containing protein n=2 Tax=Latimeria chalumnae TaxID=7897 RepID=H3AJH5_LATCH